MEAADCGQFLTTEDQGAISLTDCAETTEQEEPTEAEDCGQFLTTEDQGAVTRMPNVKEFKDTDCNAEEVWNLDDFCEQLYPTGENSQSHLQTSVSRGRLHRSVSVMNDLGEVVEESETNEINRFQEILRKYFSKATPAAIYNDLKKRLDAWKTVHINIGVVGASGVGKSTLINNFRGLRPADRRAAAVGIVQTTVEPTSYGYPKNPGVKLWDLPGVGTRDFPKEKYLSLINFEKYDFFIIVCCSRFTENDYWFASEVQKAGKRFYLVRTKVDIDIRNEQEDHPDTYNEETCLAKLREDCTKFLKKEMFGDFFIALVGKNPLFLEFPRLEEKIIFDHRNLKQEAMLFTLRTSTQKVIEEKTALLLRRVAVIAVAAGAVALIPLPGASPLVSAGLILSELKLYKEVLGLDDERLKQISEHAKVPKEDLIRAIGPHFWLDLTLKKVFNEMSNWIHQRPGKIAFLKDLLPVFRFAHSFKATPLFLRTCIENMKPAAIFILRKFLSKNYPR